MSSTWQRLLRNHPLTWGLPLGLLVVSLAIFMFYQVAYAGRIEALQDRFENETDELGTRTARRVELASYLDRVRASRGGIHALYLDHFQTPAQRQTAVLAEIQRLARAANLDPPSFSYPYDDVGDFELREMGINFRVTGTYEQLRRFINLIELTDHFLTLRAIKLDSGGGGAGIVPQLSITLSASTIFITETLARRAATARMREGAEPGRDEAAASAVDEGAETESAAATDEAEAATAAGDNTTS